MRVAINVAFLAERSEGLATYARSVIEDLSQSGHKAFVSAPERVELDGDGLAKWRRTPSSLRAEAGARAKQCPDSLSVGTLYRVGIET
jgi:hypothetical protein